MATGRSSDLRRYVRPRQRAAGTLTHRPPRRDQAAWPRALDRHQPRRGRGPGRCHPGRPARRQPRGLRQRFALARCVPARAGPGDHGRPGGCMPLAGGLHAAWHPAHGGRGRAHPRHLPDCSGTALPSGTPARLACCVKLAGVPLVRVPGGSAAPLHQEPRPREVVLAAAMRRQNYFGAHGGPARLALYCLQHNVARTD